MLARRADAEPTIREPDRCQGDCGPAPEGELHPTADQELNRGESESDAGNARDQPDQDALDSRHHEQVARARSTSAQQGQVAAIALAGPQCREVGDAEGDQGAGHCEQQKEGLGVERIPGSAVERIGEVVDELDLAGEVALDPVDGLGRPGQGARGAAGGEGRPIELGLHLPLGAGLGTGLGARPGGAGRAWGQLGRQRLREGRRQHDRPVLRGLRRGRTEQRVEGLEDDVRRRDQRHAAHWIALRRRVGPCTQPDRVADPSLERGRHLLIQHNGARAQAALQHPEGVDMRRVVTGDGENRAT